MGPGSRGAQRRWGEGAPACPGGGRQLAQSSQGHREDLPRGVTFLIREGQLQGLSGPSGSLNFLGLSAPSEGTPWLPAFPLLPLLRLSVLPSPAPTTHLQAPLGLSFVAHSKLTTIAEQK